jgi:hypothetical protein
MNVLVIYNALQTFTNTVFDHLAAFEQHSRHAVRFCHLEPGSRQTLDLSAFDAVCLHYSLRLPFDEISPQVADQIAAFKGARLLFIQDEYDHTRRAQHWIARCRFTDVFTLVPAHAIPTVYPREVVGDVRFHGALAGYAPTFDGDLAPSPPSTRALVFGYRARKLALRYGALGFDKVRIGEGVSDWCRVNGIAHDISWQEEDRIYGEDWLAFLGRCRSTLGSESGCNVFDWDGDLNEQVAAYRKANPRADDQMVYRAVVERHEIPGLMNQISPRVFESIAMRSVLVLYEGAYSGVITASRHYIPLRGDHANIADVESQLRNNDFVDAMAECAYREIIASGAYSFAAMIASFDAVVDAALNGVEPKQQLPTGNVVQDRVPHGLRLTVSPIRATQALIPTDTLAQTIRGATSPPQLAIRLVYYAWGKTPGALRRSLRPMARRMLGRAP